MTLVILAALLALPVAVLVRLGLQARWAGGYALVINLLTYWAYASDKRRAQENAWRLSEARLHLLELLGGWPAAFVAQRRLRHKCSKAGFQIVFWLIVLAWQFASFDSLQQGRYSRATLAYFGLRA